MTSGGGSTNNPTQVTTIANSYESWIQEADTNIKAFAKEKGFEVKTTELSTGEAEQLYSYADMYCNAWSTAQIAYDQGLLDDALWQGVKRDVGIAMTRWPNMRPSVARWVENSPDFTEFEIFTVLDES